MDDHVDTGGEIHNEWMLEGNSSERLTHGLSLSWIYNPHRTLQIPFPSPRLAKIAADVLEVDKDLKPEVSRRIVTTQDSIMTL